MKRNFLHERNFQTNKQTVSSISSLSSADSSLVYIVETLRRRYLVDIASYVGLSQLRLIWHSVNFIVIESLNKMLLHGSMSEGVGVKPMRMTRFEFLNIIAFLNFKFSCCVGRINKKIFKIWDVARSIKMFMDWKIPFIPYRLKMFMDSLTDVKLTTIVAKN